MPGPCSSCSPLCPPFPTLFSSSKWDRGGEGNPPHRCAPSSFQVAQGTASGGQPKGAQHAAWGQSAPCPPINRRVKQLFGAPHPKFKGFVGFQAWSIHANASRGSRDQEGAAPSRWGCPKSFYLYAPTGASFTSRGSTRAPQGEAVSGVGLSARGEGDATIILPEKRGEERWDGMGRGAGGPAVPRSPPDWCQWHKFLLE